MLYLDKRGVNIPVVAAELEEILTNNEKLAAKIKYKNTIYSKGNICCVLIYM